MDDFILFGGAGLAFMAVLCCVISVCISAVYFMDPAKGAPATKGKSLSNSTPPVPSPPPSSTLCSASTIGSNALGKTQDCMVGRGYAASQDTYKQITGQSAQECNEACVNDSECRSLYYTNDNGKNCYLFRSYYGKGTVWRDATDTNGFTTNISEGCSTGGNASSKTHQCMMGRGYAAPQDDFSYTQGQSSQQCVDACVDAPDCKSLYYSYGNNKHCHLFRSYYGKGTVWRDATDTVGFTANVSGK